MDLVQRLEKLRLAKNLTWEKLGEDLGLSRSMLHYVRTGKRDLSPRSHQRLANAEKVAGLTTPGDVLYERFKIAGLKAELSGGTLEEQQHLFSQLVLNPALGQLAEMRADVKSLLTRMEQVETRLLSEAERLLNSKRASEEQAAANKASASAKTDPSE